MSKDRKLIKIFNCNHVKQPPFFRGPIFETLVTGSHSSANGDYMGDLDGINIASHEEYSELRQQYYVWKNIMDQYEYVGFEHYRRLFFIDPLPSLIVADHYPAVMAMRKYLMTQASTPALYAGEDYIKQYIAMRNNLNAEQNELISNWVSNFDVIIQRPMLGASLKEHWHATALAAHWGVLLEAFTENPYFADNPCYVDFEIKCPSYCNMYIMKADMFRDYMDFWWNSMLILKSKIGILSPRIYGHFSERIFNFYLYQKMAENSLLRVGHLPYLFCNM